MDFLQRTPFFRLLLPFILGIILFQYIELFHWSLVSIFTGSICLIIIAYVIRSPNQLHKFRWLFGSGIFFLMLSTAYSLSTEYEKANEFDHINRKGIFNVELTAAPIEKTNSYLCKVNVIQLIDSNTIIPSNGKAILYLQKDSASAKLLYGDRLLIETEFSLPEQAQNPDGFDYAAYLKRQGVGGTSYICAESWHRTGNNPAFSIQREADKCRNYLLDIYRNFQIEADEFAVLAALTLGFTDDLQPDLRASYSATGAMHILSVSGMHVGIVYIVMAFMLSFMNKNLRSVILKTIFITIFLWVYAFITGLSPAVVRAALMFSLVALASCFERKSQIYNTIFMSAFFMLVFNPTLLFDVGSQLSYSAVLSIIFFQPAIAKFYIAKNKYSRFFWNVLSVSVAAQLGTLPITLYYFQQFPNYFLLTNIVAIPLSSVVIYLAMGLLIVSYIPYLSVAVAFLLKWSLWLLNYLIVWIQHLPYSTAHISLDLMQMLAMFFALFFFSSYFLSKRFASLSIGLTSLLLVCIFNLQTTYETLTSKRLIVYAGQKYTHVNFINRNQNYIFTTDSLEIEKIAKSYWQNQKLNSPSYLHKNEWFENGLAYFHASKIYILNAEMLKLQTIGKPLELDYLIIGKGMKPKIEQILQNFRPRKIIVDKSISRGYSERIKEVCKNRNISFYSVSEKGAFILNFRD